MERKLKRKIRIRAKIYGTKDKPRLSVFRSNKYISAQIIDDEKGETLLSLSEKSLKSGQETKAERAKALGLLLSQKAKLRKITKIIFDRGSYSYHGRVKALAEGLREGGLNF
ncbi:MAG: 50S ribosomal protein L18 [Candidatus Levybacteria bacterium GW2011_GWA2_40_8]|nr:MAG: 50S ribosomal protein L18 [Candidatus Levybacteria bacterium GW2011_GWA2_40_8]